MLSSSNTIYVFQFTGARIEGKRSTSCGIENRCILIGAAGFGRRKSPSVFFFLFLLRFPG